MYRDSPASQDSVRQVSVSPCDLCRGGSTVHGRHCPPPSSGYPRAVVTAGKDRQHQSECSSAGDGPGICISVLPSVPGKGQSCNSQKTTYLPLYLSPQPNVAEIKEPHKCTHMLCNLRILKK